MTEAHAPGKLVICGEYAVLAGAPALAAAVGVRARADVMDAGSGACLQVAGVGEWPFEQKGDGLPAWRGVPPEGRGRVLEAVAATLTARGLLLPAGLLITLDTRAFQTRPGTGPSRKLGLGSSAAITVALVAAVLAHARGAPLSRAELLPLCLDAHRRLQGGGSGVDVAAAVYGGVVALLAGPGGAPDVRLIRPLGGLHWLAVWSGQSASTPALLQRFEAFQRRDPARFERHVGELRRIAGEALAAWEGGQPPALLRSLADYDDALRALDQGACMGIYTAEHVRLALAAHAAGAVYKISGAGGGDFGIACAESAATIASLRGQWIAEGRTVLMGAGDVAGVELGD